MASPFRFESYEKRRNEDPEVSDFFASAYK
jgi:hypothetical protein